MCEDKVAGLYADDLKGIARDMLNAFMTVVDEKTALRALLALLKELGGTQYYIPKVSQVERHIRDRRVRREFNGYNRLELAGKHGDMLNAFMTVVDEKTALRLLLALLKEIGGAQYYIPKVSQVERRIRDRHIRREFNGYNRLELARKYDLAERYIWSIIERPRKDYEHGRKNKADRAGT